MLSRNTLFHVWLENAHEKKVVYKLVLLMPRGLQSQLPGAPGSDIYTLRAKTPRIAWTYYGS